MRGRLRPAVLGRSPILGGTALAVLAAGLALSPSTVEEDRAFAQAQACEYMTLRENHGGTSRVTRKRFCLDGDIWRETPYVRRGGDAGDVAHSAVERQYIQLALQEYGCYSGNIDGVFGPQTRLAVACYQEARGLPVTGELTAQQRANLIREGEDLARGAFAVAGAGPIGRSIIADLRRRRETAALDRQEEEPEREDPEGEPVTEPQVIEPVEEPIADDEEYYGYDQYVRWILLPDAGAAPLGGSNESEIQRAGLEYWRVEDYVKYQEDFSEILGIDAEQLVGVCEDVLGGIAVGAGVGQSHAEANVDLLGLHVCQMVMASTNDIEGMALLRQEMFVRSQVE